MSLGEALSTQWRNHQISPSRPSLVWPAPSDLYLEPSNNSQMQDQAAVADEDDFWWDAHDLRRTHAPHIPPRGLFTFAESRRTRSPNSRPHREELSMTLGDFLDYDGWEDEEHEEECTAVAEIDHEH